MIAFVEADGGPAPFLHLVRSFQAMMRGPGLDVRLAGSEGGIPGSAGRARAWLGCRPTWVPSGCPCSPESLSIGGIPGSGRGVHL